MTPTAALAIGTLAGILIGATLLARADTRSTEPTVEARAVAACLNGGGILADGVLYICMPAGPYAWRRP